MLIEMTSTIGSVNAVSMSACPRWPATRRMSDRCFLMSQPKRRHQGPDRDGWRICEPVIAGRVLNRLSVRAAALDELGGVLHRFLQPPALQRDDDREDS